MRYANLIAKAVENNEILIGEGRVLAGTRFENFKLHKLGGYFRQGQLILVKPWNSLDLNTRIRSKIYAQEWPS